MRPQPKIAIKKCPGKAPEICVPCMIDMEAEKVQHPDTESTRGPTV